MNDTAEGRRGSITQVGSILQINNALVEDVYTSNSRTGYVIVSYSAPGQNEMVYIELLQLNIGWDTILVNQFGDPISLCTINKGMWVNAEFLCHDKKHSPSIKGLPDGCNPAETPVSHNNGPDRFR